MDGATPELLEVAAAGVLRPPVVAHQVVARTFGAVGEGGEEFVDGAALVERLDERLNDRDRAVVRARVRPRFEEVGFGDVPVAQLRGLVVVRAEVDAEAHLLKARAEVEVGRRVVDGVAADDDEHLDLALVDVGQQLSQRLDVIDGVRVNRLGVHDGLPRVAERGVDRVRERVDDGRRVLARDHDGLAAVRL